MSNQGYSRSPRLLKGALVEFSERFLGPVPNIILFQYNPESVTRTLEVWNPEEKEGGQKTPGVSPSAAPTTQPADPPETFSLTLILDATDALENPDLHPAALVSGVADRLAALELLLYPQPDDSLLGGLLGSLAGSLGGGAAAITTSAGASPPAQPVPPRKVPVVLFVWGPGRIVPVRLTSFVVEEQTYSTLLFPLRARVTTGFKVLTPSDYPSPREKFSEKLAVKAFEFTRKQKEVLAAANAANSVESILGMLPF